MLLASASNAIIIGLNVRPERKAQELADQEKVDIRLHSIIYELQDEIKRAMTGLLEPTIKDEVAHVSHVLPDGRTLLDDVSFRIGEGLTAALVGPNGAGKTTLLRMVAGDIQPQSGTVAATGGLGVMRQFIGTDQGHQVTPGVRDLLLSVSPPRVREAAARLDAAEMAMMERDDERVQLRYAAALAEWGEAGGYDAEVHWDACCVAAFGIPYDQCRWRDVSTLSGGEQKRLVLESLLRGTDGVLLLDEPDNYLDVPGKRWLEQQLAATPKTVLLVSHDRELLAACAQRIVTVEDRHVWVHGGGFSGYAQARTDRISAAGGTAPPLG